MHLQAEAETELGPLPGAQKPAVGIEGLGWKAEAKSLVRAQLLSMLLFPSDRNMPKAITHLPEAEKSHM